MKKIECTDYDSMGNYGRFPATKKKEKTGIDKIVLWIYATLKQKSGK